MLDSYSRYQSVSNALKASYEKQVANEYGQCSQLWNDIFDHRASLKNYSDLAISLNDRFSFTTGIAGAVPESKKGLFAKYYNAFLDEGLLRELPISPIGAPSVMDINGVPTSVPHLSNLQLFDEVRYFLKRHLSDRKELHVVEIGAGYGGLAYFMLKSGLAKSYTVVDLAQNLEISAFHLTQNFPDMKFNVLSSKDAMAAPAAGTLNFVTPGNIDALANCRFDLALNSDSLGEMPASTAQSYIKWIREHLDEGGCFFSKNGHRRSPDAIQFPSEYGYDALELLELKPPSVISTLFDDFSHYAFLKKASSPRKFDSAHLDALCALYALGLQGELKEISLAFSEKRLNPDQTEFLATARAFFAEKSLKGKLDVLGRYTGSELKSSVQYLKGITSYVMGNYGEASKLMTEYLKSADSYVAEAYAAMILSRRDPSVLSNAFKFGVKTEFALNEIKGFHEMAPPLKILAMNLRADVLRKKINTTENYKPSNLMTIKNVVFNLKEGRGFTARRI